MSSKACCKRTAYAGFDANLLVIYKGARSAAGYPTYRAGDNSLVLCPRQGEGSSMVTQRACGQCAAQSGVGGRGELAYVCRRRKDADVLLMLDCGIDGAERHEHCRQRRGHRVLHADSHRAFQPGTESILRRACASVSARTFRAGRTGEEQWSFVSRHRQNASVSSLGHSTSDAKRS